MWQSYAFFRVFRRSTFGLSSRNRNRKGDSPQKATYKATAKASRSKRPPGVPNESPQGFKKLLEGGREELQEAAASVDDVWGGRCSKKKKRKKVCFCCQLLEGYLSC